MSEDFAQYSVTEILNALPENKPLYKDSGSWQIRSDDMETVIFQQGVNESFRSFLIKYIQTFENDFDLYEDFLIRISK